MTNLGSLYDLLVSYDTAAYGVVPSNLWSTPGSIQENLSKLSDEESRIARRKWRKLSRRALRHYGMGTKNWGGARSTSNRQYFVQKYLIEMIDRESKPKEGID